MNDIIHVLPDAVANMVAANEVVDNPSSAVKELMENSLDAGADRIQIILTDSGRTCIQVIDNGKGMSETDARLAFERHATSKINTAQDVFNLHTMGFRGEALAAICAIAQVELTTRRAEDELGTRIIIEGSDFKSQEPIACPVGSNFKVKNLFYNYPVRRDFMRSPATQKKQIIQIFERVALAHPEVSFLLATPDEVIYDLPVSNFRQRVVNIFGKNLDKNLLNVEVQTDVVEIKGYVGTPQSNKRKGAQLFFFVNGRFMIHPLFAKAVQKAYERLIPEGSSVPFFLHLIVPPETINVNLSPAKTKIEFTNESTIFHILTTAVHHSLGKFADIPSIDFDTEDRPDIPIFNGDPTDVAPPQIHINPDFNPFETTPSKQRQNHKGSHPYVPGIRHDDPVFENQQFTFSPPQDLPTADPSLYAPNPDEEKETINLDGAEFLLYQGRYMLTPVESGLLVIDAPRAHVRVLYEEYLENIHADGQESQGLLFTDLLELPPSQANVLESLMPELERIGFNLSPLGGGTFSVLGIPNSLNGVDHMKLLESIIADAQQHTVNAEEEMQKSIALTMAHKSAIPVGQALTQEEMHSLATRLLNTGNPNITPDGKTILHILPSDVIISPLR